MEGVEWGHITQRGFWHMFFLLPDYETGIRDSWAPRGRCSEREEQIFRKHGQKFVKKKDKSLKNIFMLHCYSLRLFSLPTKLLPPYLTLQLRAVSDS